MKANSFVFYSSPLFWGVLSVFLLHISFVFSHIPLSHKPYLWGHPEFQRGVVGASGYGQHGERPALFLALKILKLCSISDKFENHGGMI